MVLQNLDLSQNQLTGDISVLALMPFLARARVSENRLTGSLPPHMASSFLQVKLQLSFFIAFTTFLVFDYLNSVFCKQQAPALT